MNCSCEGCGREQQVRRDRHTIPGFLMPSEWCGYGARRQRPSATALWCPQCQADGTMDRDNSFVRRSDRQRRRRRDYHFAGHGSVHATLTNGAEVTIDFTATTTTTFSGHLRRSARLIEGMSRRAREWMRLATPEAGT